MIREPLAFKGEIWVHRILPNGKRELMRHQPNLVLTTGKVLAITRLVGVAKAALSHMGIGTSTTAPAVGQTGLITPLGARVPFDSAPVINGQTVTMTATFGPDYVGVIAEFLLANALTNGDAFSRAILNPGIPKTAADTIAVTWAITAP